MSPISEDELRARLRSVEPAPARPGLAEHAIHQGRFRRRRQRWVTGIAAAAAVVTIGGGAFVISDQLGPETALPATPTPTSTQPEVTPTVTSTTSPTGTKTVSPSPTSTPTNTTTGSANSRPSSTPTPSSTPSRSITLKPVAFLHEGVKGDGETTSDWKATTEVTGPCGTNARSLAGQHGAAESRAIRGGGGDGGATGEAFFVFANADSAVAFMGQLRELTRTCAATTNGETRGVVEALEGPWGEGIAFTSFPNEPTVGGGPVGLAVRSGRAVAMSTSAGPFDRTDQVNPGLVSSARPGVEHLFPQLCRFTKAGC